MTIGELKKLIAPLSNSLEITVRCAWESSTPDGNCFHLTGVTVQDDHVTEEDFAAFDCDQEEE